MYILSLKLESNNLQLDEILHIQKLIFNLGTYNPLHIFRQVSGGAPPPPRQKKISRHHSNLDENTSPFEINPPKLSRARANSHFVAHRTCKSTKAKYTRTYIIRSSGRNSFQIRRKGLQKNVIFETTKKNSQHNSAAFEPTAESVELQFFCSKSDSSAPSSTPTADHSRAPEQIFGQKIIIFNQKHSNTLPPPPPPPRIRPFSIHRIVRYNVSKRNFNRVAIC